MYKELFSESGLTKNEALIYEYLLKNGESAALDIAKNTPLKKGVIYLALADLKEKGIISEKLLTPKNPNVRNKKKIAYFCPEHPEKLREYLENQEAKIKKAQKNFEANLSGIVSSFNLISNMPGIRVYEGRKGLVRVLNDSLGSKTEILTYAQIEGMERYLKKDNDIYVEKRKSLGIKKRGIVADTAYARDYLKDYDRSVTDVRLIDGDKYPMFLEMEIYDNKISFMTFSEKQLIGVIIENAEIYQTQKSIFELVWSQAVPLINKEDIKKKQ